MENKLIEPSDEVGRPACEVEAGEVKRSEQLGGLLNYYHRDAA